MKTHHIRTLAECDGHDFRNFQWMAIGRMRGFPSDAADVKPITHLVGMKILTTNSEIIVYGNGSVETKPLPDGVKNVNFATYGK